MPNDDWKGEAFIRRKPTSEERHVAALSLGVKLWHKNRPVKQAQAGGPWARSIAADFKRAKITGSLE